MPKDPLRASMDEAPACAKGLKPVLDRSDADPVLSSPHRARRTRNFLLANVAVLVCIVLVAGTTIFALSSLPAKTQAYTTHNPIVIMGAGGFLSDESGVVSGTGAPSDPYIISGWRITVNTFCGIYIEYNEGVSFVIVDVQVNGVEAPIGQITGIWFVGVTHGQIKNCLINDTTYGVDLLSSQDCSVHGNEFLDNDESAIRVQDCNRLHVVNNRFVGQTAIQATLWQNSNVMLNEFVSNSAGISASDLNSLTVKENIATNCGRPAYFSYSTNVQVINNQFLDCTYGVEFSRVTWSDIRGNVIDGTTATGITAVSNSYTLLVADNVVNGTETNSGIFLQDSWDVNITRNMISNNSAGGVSLQTGCYDVLVFNNSFVDNSPQAQDVAGSVNHWNKTYPVGGNYWSDYGGADNNSGPGQNVSGGDGFGDTDYVIDADSADNYPRMDPVPVTVRPVASFTADPNPGDVTVLITFDGSSSYHPNPPKNITGYKWDFEGDGIFDTSASNPITAWLYPVPGEYAAILEVEDKNGMTDMIILEITIVGEGIISEFGTVLVPVLALVVLVVIVSRHRTPV